MLSFFLCVGFGCFSRRESCVGKAFPPVCCFQSFPPECCFGRAIWCGFWGRCVCA